MYERKRLPIREPSCAAAANQNGRVVFLAVRYHDAMPAISAMIVKTPETAPLMTARIDLNVEVGQGSVDRIGGGRLIGCRGQATLAIRA
jgi:hypothetical protein